MQLADRSLPKRNARTDGIYGEDEPCFCNAREVIGEIIPRSAGKILLLCSGGALPCVMPYAQNPRTITLVDEEDALPLFSMPDGVSAIVALGGESMLTSARFFARIRNAKCYLFPTSAGLHGGVGKTGRVRIGGKVSRMPLAEGELLYDEGLLADSLAEGYGELLLSRLAAFEERALAGLFCREERGDTAQAELLTKELPATLAGVLQSNYALRLLEGSGLPAGEARTLAEGYRAAGASLPFWRAFRALIAVYSAFFECGVPRRYLVPDYSARALAAGEAKSGARVPEWREYARRAFSLERVRGSMLTRVKEIRASLPAYRAALSRLVGELPAGKLNEVKLLPERAPDGLCAVIRDFGLLE